MKCVKCSKKSEINFRHLGSLCNKCFLKVIEKRVRKGLRINRMISKNDRILFIDNGSAEFKVGYFLLKNIIKDLPVKINVKKSKKLDIADRKYDKIIIPWNLEDECGVFLGALFDNQKTIKFSKKAIKLLMNVSEDEIHAFAKIKKFKFPKKSKSKIRKMLDTLENRYTGYKFSLLNSAKQVS